MQSDAVRCSQMQSDAVRCSQMQSDAVRDACKLDSAERFLKENISVQAMKEQSESPDKDLF